MWDSAFSSTGRSSVASLPLIFSSKTFRQIGSRASCCRWVNERTTDGLATANTQGRYDGRPAKSTTTPSPSPAT